MEFQLEHITSSITGKTYLLVKYSDPGVHFKLSDHSFLGGVAIEKRYDIPKSVDTNGVPRTDLLSFVLKNEADKDQLKEGDFLKLSDAYTDVIESFYTVSGKMGACINIRYRHHGH